jgi:transposase
MELSAPQPRSPQLSPEDIRAVYRAGESAVVALVQALQSHIAQLELRVEHLQTRVAELEARLARDSTNSHQPPASDGWHKPPPRSLREKSGRKPGGQPGHAGRTLQPVPQPDRLVVHPLERCPCGRCGGCSLREQPVLEYEKRQVFELPEPALVVTEHRAEVKVCPVSGQWVRAEFPAEARAPAQYGPRFQGLLVYLNQQHFVPSERLTQLCEDLYGQPLSEGAVQAANERVAQHLSAFERSVADQLVQAALVHVDESGVRVAGKLHWLHVASTAQLTCYGIHPKRGRAALDELGIVPRCRNWVLHDHWPPYFTYPDCRHALCNQHLLRELKFLAQERQEAWAQNLKQYLQHCHQRRQKEGPLGPPQFRSVRTRFRALVRAGRQDHPRRTGRQRQSPAANLLDRLEAHEGSFLAFLSEPGVPFTNNQAEQDIRMLKVRQKISGGFRTPRGAQIFARIRSYLSTCRKQGRNLWTALQQAVVGQPFIPEPSTDPG